MGDTPDTFFHLLMSEIEASEKSMDCVFHLAKKGTPITVDLLERKGGTKQELSKIIINLVNQMKKNSDVMRKAGSEIEQCRGEAMNGHIEVTKLQKELLVCKSEKVNRFQNSFDEQLKSYSDALMQNVKEQPDNSTAKGNMSKSLIQTVVKSAIKETHAELDRSKNLVLFGLEEETEETNHGLGKTVIGLLEDMGIEDKIPKVRRLGTIKKTDKPRPVLVTLEQSSEIQEILMKRKNLKTTDYFHDVYMAPDRTPAERKKHAALVKKLKEKIKEMPEKRFYLKNDEIHCDEKAKKVSVDRENNSYYMFGQV